MSPEMYAKVMNGFWGFVLGAGVAMIIGFVWGGWTTSSTTQRMNEEAVLTSRAAICVAQFMTAPNRKVNLKQLEGVADSQRAEFVETGGWDRMPGEDKAAWGVSSACVSGLEALIKTGGASNLIIDAPLWGDLPGTTEELSASAALEGR